MAGAPFPALTRARTLTHARSLQIWTQKKRKKKWNLLANVYPLTGGEQAEGGAAGRAGCYLAGQRPPPAPPVNRLSTSACGRGARKQATAIARAAREKLALSLFPLANAARRGGGRAQGAGSSSAGGVKEAGIAPFCLCGPLCHCCGGIELGAPHLTTAEQ